ncbi:hypothetical protein KAR91_88270 [Candidatus Pacearchaeota archaeon]|nr:hypothetical protein [Candidatus Pacearchaeota archaeon]
MTGLIRACDNIYGKQVVAECKDQMNVQKWKGNDPRGSYIENILKKDLNFFSIWSKLSTAVICVIEREVDEELDDDVLEKVCIKKNDAIKGKRVILWSNDEKYKRILVSARGGGHRHQGGVFKDNTFCVKDVGVMWKGRNP